MALFGKKATTTALLDIRSSSIGAAYVVAVPGQAPMLVHQVRVPLAPNATEPFDDALLRTLQFALKTLIAEGAAPLMKQTGSGRTDAAFVTFAAPWQASTVVSRVIEKDKPFLFTKQTLKDAATTSAPEQKGMTRVSELVIATLLNGYEVNNPFGKKASRAELIVLTSALDTALMETVRQLVRKTFHQPRISFAPFMPETYTVMRDLYPHQRDYVILDIGSEASEVLVAKHGLLISITSIERGIGELARAARSIGVSSPTVPLAGQPGDLVDPARNTAFATKVSDAERVWVAAMQEAIGAIASQEPLPRSVFLLSEDNVREFLKRLLDDDSLRKLWLSTEPLALMPLTGAPFASLISVPDATPVDPALGMLALAATKSVETV